MRSFKIKLIQAVVAGGAVVGSGRSGLAQPPNNLRIVLPQNGQKISSDFVEIRYTLLNPAATAADTPTYELQLDGNTPVDTIDTSYTFTGLAPGQHTVIVQLVDANGTPVAGSTSSVHFTVLAPQPPPGAGPRPELTPASQSQKAQPKNQQELPDANSALPVLSVIGFGVLVGGIASALKTR
jgi:hypothetical protein